MWNARIGAIIYPGYVLQHLLSDDRKGGSLFVFDGMVERVANVVGDGYYDVRRENRQVKIPQHTFCIQSRAPSQSVVAGVIIDMSLDS
jgi:hypothetical protein